MHLVKNDQFVQMVSQIKFWLGKLGSVLLGLHIQIKRVLVAGVAYLQS